MKVLSGKIIQSEVDTQAVYQGLRAFHSRRWFQVGGKSEGALADRGSGEYFFQSQFPCGQ